MTPFPDRRLRRSQTAFPGVRFDPWETVHPLDPNGLRPKYRVTVSSGALLCALITRKMSEASCTQGVQPRAGLVMSQPGEDYAMKWKTPRIVEIAVGMEINCYACAEI